MTGIPNLTEPTEHQTIIKPLKSTLLRGKSMNILKAASSHIHSYDVVGDGYGPLAPASTTSNTMHVPIINFFFALISSNKLSFRCIATSISSAYSPPSPPPNSSDTTSPIYPDRPIRPLPKRRLRSRLSSELADSIQYPPAPCKPLLYLPYNDSAPYINGALATGGVTETDQALSQAQHVSNGDSKNGYQFKGNDADSDEEDGVGIIRRYQEQRQAMTYVPRNFAHGAGRAEFGKPMKPTISQSAASSIDSVDGYDSFENTNNKKKRKIPTPGALGSHSSSLSAEMANMGISVRDVEASHAESDGGVGQYYGTGNSAVPAVSSGTGISGAGRGRYGRASLRNAGGRSPLGVSMNGLNASQAVRASAVRRDYTMSGNTSGKDSAAPQLSDRGIISAAIANAAALPAISSKGQENVSLLEQQSGKKSSSTKTQFTFTCESDSAKAMVWPGQQSLMAGVPYGTPPQSSMPRAQSDENSKDFATQGTQTSPSIVGQPAPQHTGASQPALQEKKKPRRPPGKQYAMAARERRLQQSNINYHHPPSNEEIWICEFCEYESIFGSPPEALVRQYEIKDQRERRRLAEKQRLLEKAKSKGRKGKKGSKNAAKNAATQVQQPAPRQALDQQPTDKASMHHQGIQSEEHLADDYEDDPIPVSVPSPSRIPQPIAQYHNQSLRSAAGDVITNAGGTASVRGA